MSNLATAADEFISALKNHFEAYGSDALHALAPFEERVKSLAAEAERATVNWTKKVVAEVKEEVEAIETEIGEALHPAAAPEEDHNPAPAPTQTADGEVSDQAPASDAVVVAQNGGEAVEAAITETAGGKVTEVSEDPAPAA